MKFESHCSAISWREMERLTDVGLEILIKSRAYVGMETGLEEEIEEIVMMNDELLELLKHANATDTWCNLTIMSAASIYGSKIQDVSNFLDQVEVVMKKSKSWKYDSGCEGLIKFCFDALVKESGYYNEKETNRMLGILVLACIAPNVMGKDIYWWNNRSIHG